MNVTVVHGDKLASFTLDASAPVSTLKTLVQTELKIPADDQRLFFKGSFLRESVTLQQAGLQNQDVIELRLASSDAPSKSESLATMPREVYSDPRLLLEYIKANPKLMQELIHANPPLAEAVLSDNAEVVSAILQQQEMTRRQAEMQVTQRQNAMARADPFDQKVQAQIAEEIRKKNIEENMEMAMEHNPESFARVVMLYVPVEVNRVNLVAFVDSGAQSTIMSEACAKRCGIMRLCDSRFAGFAKGVGTAKILGRVHSAMLKIGKSVIQCAFSIIENQDMDFLFGLDQLRKHQAAIDLKINCLRIAGEDVPFLPEKDLPASVRSGGPQEQDAEMPTSAGPNSATRPSSNSRSATTQPPSSSAASASSASASSTSAAATRPPSAAVVRPPAATVPMPGGASGPYSASIAPSPASSQVPSTSRGAAPSASSAAQGPVNPADLMRFLASLAAASQQPPATAAGAIPANRTSQPAAPTVNAGGRMNSPMPLQASTGAAVSTAPRASVGGPANAGRVNSPMPAQVGGPPQAHIDTLIGMGFSRSDALEALSVTGGNLELAASYLFSR